MSDREKEIPTAPGNDPPEPAEESQEPESVAVVAIDALKATVLHALNKVRDDIIAEYQRMAKQSHEIRTQLGELKVVVNDHEARIKRLELAAGIDEG